MLNPIASQADIIAINWDVKSAEPLYYGGMFGVGLCLIAVLGGLTPAATLIPACLLLSFYHHPMMNKSVPALMFAPEGIGIRGIGVVTWPSINEVTTQSSYIRTMEQRSLLIHLSPHAEVPQPSMLQRLQIRLGRSRNHLIEVNLNLLAIDDDTQARLSALLNESRD